LRDIVDWLTENGLAKHAPLFAEAEIEFGDLAYLSDDDLKELGLPLGPRRRIEAAIRTLSDKTGLASEERVSVVPPSPPVESAPASDAERRHLTVMFVDLVGSTEMATRLDAEDMRDVITSYQNTVAGVVSRYEGFVAKFMGDGVLCYFGWPRANEDDAERAVRAGLSIIDAVRKARAPNGSLLSTRVGIATGVVIVGDLIGSGATQEAAVVGETPNLAARLQGVAGQNQLVVARETQRLLGVIFDLRRLDGQDLKGISGPVDAYVVEGEAKVQSRFAARQSGTMMPIIGREREIELMVERWAIARSGQGQMALVTGEAGIGKSRITQAMIDEVTRQDHIRVSYQCSPYHADSAFYPVVQQMSAAAGFVPSDDVEARLDKLEALVGADEATLKLIAPLLGLDGAPRYGVSDLTPAQQRARTMKALASLLVRQAAEKPLLLLYEDLHWIDPTSLELLDLLLDAIIDQPIMILATARPTFEHGFGGHPIVTRFALNRLGKDQISGIVSKLTDGKVLPDDIMAIIAQRTDGVPLFVEELTKTILESGALKEEGERLVLNGPLSAIAIPATLHDSLMARLDRLQPIKEVAQTAACIGREFSHGLLAQISHLSDAELYTALDGLIAAELIYRRGLPPEATYLFKHALVRDAAYESLLKEKRRAVHARILTALETDTTIAPEVLAFHAEAANFIDRATDLWEAAGKAAMARPAFAEGAAHLTHAIALLAPMIDKGERAPLERSLILQVQLGYALMAGCGYGHDRTKSALEHALALADRIGETPLRFSILFGLMTTRYFRAEIAEAVHHGQAFVDLTEGSTDTAHACTANRSLGISLMFSGQFERAQHHLDRALDLYDPILHRSLARIYGVDLGVSSHAIISSNLFLLGETRRGNRLRDECERLAEVSADVASRCNMHMNIAFFHLSSRNLTELERHTTSLVDLANQFSLSFYGDLATMLRGLLLAGSGDPAGLDDIARIDARMVASNMLGLLAMLRTEAGHCALALGFQDEAARFAALAKGLMDETGENMWLSHLHRLYADMARADSDGAAEESHLNTAIEVASRQGAKLFELRAAIDLASLWRDQGKNIEAISLLQPIHDSIAEGDCPEDRATSGELLIALAG